MANVGPSSKKKGKGKIHKGTSSSEREDRGSDINMADAVATKRHKWNPRETRKEIVSRTALRKVFRETNTDCEIEEFFDEIGETLPPLRKLLINGSKVKRKHKSRRHAHSDDESDSNNSDSDSDSNSDSSSIFVSSKKKGRRQAREVDDDNSSDNSSSGGRKRSRMPKRRNSKTKKTKTIESNNQDIFASTMQKFIKQLAKDSRRQEEVMSKRFKEVLSRIPV
ncbi:uncharacterized protein K441DRAFT_701104 [Cenococcum geophilum 1.58]|uniref:Uncharacterized protein n=1 Tax=Cenococcum geophilum 1.58 TaxID=794803 RepID=A0ACC8EPU7_9PEZI|nr:hypothetical protein K441DRAFT_701104 [Cenococcum geophilum 1.58]